MSYTLDNTDGYKVMDKDAIKIQFPNLEELNDWIMRNTMLLSQEEIDKFYGWSTDTEHG